MSGAPGERDRQWTHSKIQVEKKGTFPGQIMNNSPKGKTIHFDGLVLNLIMYCTVGTGSN